MSSASHLGPKVADWRHRIRVAAAAPSPQPSCTVPFLRHPASLPQPASTATAGAPHRPCCRPSSSSAAQRHHTRLAAPAATGPSGAAGAAPAAAALAVGEAVQVTCDRLGTGGVGVCLFGPSQLVLLVKGALPGEQLTAVIIAVKKNYAEARKVSTQQPHRDAALPACQHFGVCGGCSLQALSYPAQLAHKTDHVRQLLSRVGRIDAAAVTATQQPPIAAAAVYGYRNKVQMAFSSLVFEAGACSAQEEQSLQQQQQQRQHQAHPLGPGCVRQGFGLGYFLPGSNSVVVPIQECSIASAEANHITREVRRLCQEHGLQPHNSPCGTGVLRHLIIRSAAAAVADHTDALLAAGSTPPEGHTLTAAVTANGTQGDVVLSPAVPSAGGALMAVLVTSPGVDSQPHALNALSAVAQELLQACPGLASVIHSVEAGPAPGAAAAASSKAGDRLRSGGAARATGRSNGRGSKRAGSSGGSSEARGLADPDADGSGSSRGAQPLRVQSSRVLAGAGGLVESMCGLQFQVSPHSFFQTNTAQAERLYLEVVHAVAEAVGAGSGGAGAGVAADSSSRLVLDLYCGTGTIALCLAHRLREAKVVGFDVSASSIADAEANAARNGLSNVAFVCGDLNQLLPARPAAPKQGRRGSKPQAPPHQAPEGLQQLQPKVVVVDPARAGLGAGVVQYLLQCGAERVVYVSCNAATQARDLQLLCAGGAFRLSSWTCVDLFPQTDVAHVETVVVLDRAGGGGV